MIVVEILLVIFALMWAFAVTSLLRQIGTETRLIRRLLEQLAHESGSP